MGHLIIASGHYFAQQEATNEGACMEAAEEHGVGDQADMCDAGHLGCPNCPRQ